MASNDREYDIVLFGATGYTGLYTAEHITTHLPTNISWAIAGRSSQKLASVVEGLKRLNPDRKVPAIEIAQLNREDLHVLAKKTKILINTVGPFTLYGSPVVEACAENGTHYLDVTGESPWVLDMIRKYHERAQATGAIIIPQIGVESAPADMLTYALASFLRKTASVSTKEVVVSLHGMKGAPSGGTISTIITIFDKYGLGQIAHASSPSAMCPISLPQSRGSQSLLSRFTGVRTVAGLGTLTTSLQGTSDNPLVHRSWGLLSSNRTGDESYGPNFHFSPYMSVRNAFVGALVHLAITFLPLFLVFPPFRWAMAKMVTQPGQGPSREDSRNDYVEYRAVAVADSEAQQWAHARFYWQGSAYHLTGVTVAEGAATILLNEDIAARKLGGGLLTPATLGQAYLDRLTKAGIVLETRMVER